jgi:hypothetical protein
LDKNIFIFILAHSPHLLFNSPLGMVYELLWYCFVLDDFGSGFDFFFDICGHIVHGHVLPSISCLLVASWLLALDKQARNVQPIAIKEVIYQMVIHTIVI